MHGVGHKDYSWRNARHSLSSSSPANSKSATTTPNRYAFAPKLATVKVVCWSLWRLPTSIWRLMLTTLRPPPAMSHTTRVGDAPPAPSGSSQKVPSWTAPARRCDANSVKHVLAADVRLPPLSSVGELVGPADGDEVRTVGKLLQAHQITTQVAVAASSVRRNS